MNALTLLKQDHRKARKLFADILETSDRAQKTREALFSQLKTELNIHAHIEEVVFYPAVENFEETRDIVLESYEEHRVVRDLLEELMEEEKDTEEWRAKFTVLKENTEHHIEEEEGELFKEVERLLSAEDLEEMGVSMEEEKQGMAETLN